MIYNNLQAIGGAIQVDVQTYQAPQIVKGPMAESGLIIPMWKDEDATPVPVVAPDELKSVILTGAQTNNMISILCKESGFL